MEVIWALFCDACDMAVSRLLGTIAAEKRCRTLSARIFRRIFGLRYARIASINGLAPRMLMTRFKL